MNNQNFNGEWMKCPDCIDGYVKVPPPIPEFAFHVGGLPSVFEKIECSTCNGSGKIRKPLM